MNPPRDSTTLTTDVPDIVSNVVPDVVPKSGDRMMTRARLRAESMCTQSIKCV
jgi:hypothetical protein